MLLLFCVFLLLLLHQINFGFDSIKWCEMKCPTFIHSTVLAVVLLFSAYVKYYSFALQCKKYRESQQESYVNVSKMKKKKRENKLSSDLWAFEVAHTFKSLAQLITRRTQVYACIEARIQCFWFFFSYYFIVNVRVKNIFWLAKAQQSADVTNESIHSFRSDKYKKEWKN